VTASRGSCSGLSAFLKKACALMNRNLGLLPEDKAWAIVQVTEEVIEGRLDDHFPLVV
jgi:fumarate hydratase class II